MWTDVQTLEKCCKIKFLNRCKEMKPESLVKQVCIKVTKVNIKLNLPTAASIRNINLALECNIMEMVVTDAQALNLLRTKYVEKWRKKIGLTAAKSKKFYVNKLVPNLGLFTRG